MSILGLTIDYGPFGFLGAFDPKFTPNSTDLPGRRYCFANQPDIGLWNIAQFTTSLQAAPLINEKEANYAMERYGTRFMDDYQVIMTKKLGLPKYNKQMINKLLSNMAVDKVDYTNIFRTLSNVKAETNIPDDELLVPLKSVLLDIGKERKEAWTSWLKAYIHEVSTSGIPDDERKIWMGLGGDKDKRRETLDKEDKLKKSVSINEFLKSPECESYYNAGGRRRGARGGYGGYATANITAPSIEDPTLRVK
eukprot:XP_006590233.1 uncharacterized protein LOC102663557 [Glycine max]